MKKTSFTKKRQKTFGLVDSLAYSTVVWQMSRLGLFFYSLNTLSFDADLDDGGDGVHFLGKCDDNGVGRAVVLHLAVA